MKTQLKKGFTLVEIMIVVVIIGLLAALAIPAFKKVRNNAIEKTLINDARQISSAANQIMSENAINVVPVEQLCKYVAGARLSAGVEMVSSTTAAPASGAVLLNGFAIASGVIPANTVIGTVNAAGAITPGTGVLGTVVQGGGFVLRQTNFDKALASNERVRLSGTTGTWTGAIDAVPPGVAGGALTVRTDVAFSVDTGEVL